MSLVGKLGLRLGIILLVCAGITVVTSTFLQTPMGTAALASALRRPGPPGVPGVLNRVEDQRRPEPAAGVSRGRGGGAPQAGPGAFRQPEAGPREGGGRLLPNIPAGLPEVLRSAATMGALALGVALLLKVRRSTRRPARVRVSATSARPAHGGPATT
jgi:hypothetical protein